ncbi:Helix-turn-helix domain-containing protein [Nakamurella panacisegetis]|uniref:Helix-turn-helix domain-containing protein n=1 Tax=Nakamurella panacisegetis TaxID=1090615 RepID=A0A1H0PZZ4_9ACTN|nr:Helix-turn-helix domain-containing protein [Nakamurella panacisegetis]
MVPPRRHPRTGRPSMSDRLTVADVCALYGVKPGTVRSWLSRGHITRTRAGGIDGPSLARWLSREAFTPRHLRTP